MTQEERLKYRRQYDYDAFTQKFAGKKEQDTDDCYTPADVYEAVLEWIDKYYPLAGKHIVRPFYPNGDFENYDYQANDVVIDNPPFSIYSEVARFYASRNIPFFLWAPHLQNFIPDLIGKVTFLPIAFYAIYHNGARVRTAFISNLFGNRGIWMPKDLSVALQGVQPQTCSYSTPTAIQTSALFSKYSYTDICLNKDEVRGLTKASYRELTDNGWQPYGRPIMLTPMAVLKMYIAKWRKARNEKQTKVKINLLKYIKLWIENFSMAL